jgi:hypothetical protein
LGALELEELCASDGAAEDVDVDEVGAEVGHGRGQMAKGKGAKGKLEEG